MKVRQAARRDANHNQIVRVFETAGASWQDTSRVSGALDGTVGYAGIDQRVEIKDGAKPPSKKKLTPEEIEVFQAWRGRQPVVIESEDEALALLAHMRLESTLIAKIAMKARKG